MSGRTLCKMGPSLCRTLLWITGWDPALWLLRGKCQLEPQVIVMTTKHHTCFTKHSQGNSSTWLRTSILTHWASPSNLWSATGEGSVHLWEEDQQSVRASGSYPYEAVPVTVHSFTHPFMEWIFIWTPIMFQTLLWVLEKNIKIKYYATANNNYKNFIVKIPAFIELTQLFLVVLPETTGTRMAFSPEGSKIIRIQP